MTKVKGRKDLFNLLGIMGFGSLSGRADIAPIRSKSWNVAQVSCAAKASRDGLDIDMLDLFVHIYI